MKGDTAVTPGSVDILAASNPEAQQEASSWSFSLFDPMVIRIQSSG